jgi:L-amino acid N-acyltransferase YncA
MRGLAAAGPFAFARRLGQFRRDEPIETRMSTPTLRPATAADIPAITAIYRPAVLTGTASFELEPPAEDEMLRRFRAIVDGGYPYFVAELDGRVAGYAYAGAYRTRPAYRFTVENSVYIAPDAQGKGVGRALLAALIDTCTRQGFRLMVAVIGDSANFASIALHRRAGFTFCGTIHSVGYKFGRWLDSVIMQLPLGQGDTSAPAERDAPRT